MSENGKKMQVEMHKDFFEHTTFAIDNGFYLEAVFREHAAIEGRLEVISGLLGAPCNKNISSSDRRKVNISHRIKCIKKCYEQTQYIRSKKIDKKFFVNLENWIKKRNTIVHGLYKNELEYKERSAANMKLSEEGLVFCRMLYNEVKRLRRYLRTHTSEDNYPPSICRESGCILCDKKGEFQQCQITAL